MKSRSWTPSKKKRNTIYFKNKISVCERWLNFRNFLDDMAKDFRPGLTLERKNGRLGYFPENCCWATYKEQANNTHTNLRLSFNGAIRTLKQWAESTGIKSGTLRYRIKNGWDMQKAFNEVPKPKRYKINKNEKEKEQERSSSNS